MELVFSSVDVARIIRAGKGGALWQVVAASAGIESESPVDADVFAMWRCPCGKAHPHTDQRGSEPGARWPSLSELFRMTTEPHPSGWLSEILTQAVSEAFEAKTSTPQGTEEWLTEIARRLSENDWPEPLAPEVEAALRAMFNGESMVEHAGVAGDPLVEAVAHAMEKCTEVPEIPGDAGTEGVAADVAAACERPSVMQEAVNAEACASGTCGCGTEQGLDADPLTRDLSDTEKAELLHGEVKGVPTSNG